MSGGGGSGGGGKKGRPKRASPHPSAALAEQGRKAQGLNRTSVVDIVAADDGGRYAAIIDGKVAVKLGPAPWDPGEGWQVATDGNDYAVWTRRS